MGQFVKKSFSEVFKELDLPTEVTNIVGSALVDKVTVNGKKNKIKIKIFMEKIVNEKNIEKIENSIKQGLGVFEQVILDIRYRTNDTLQEKISLYWHNMLNLLWQESPIEYSVMSNSKWEIVENTLLIKLDKNSKYVLKAKKTDEKLKKIFKKKLGLDLQIQLEEIVSDKIIVKEDFILQKTATVQKQHEENVVEKKETPQKNNQGDKKTFKRKARQKNGIRINPELEESPVRIKTSIEQDCEIVIEGEIIEVEKRELRNGSYLVSADITDKSDSVTIKFFVDSDLFKEEFANVVKKGNVIRTKGFVRYDVYSRELNIMVNEIRPMEKVSTVVEDEEEIKRVELHLHTNMSAMDGVTNIKKYVKRAEELGHKALAITDHGVVQAYPDAMDAVAKSDLKIIYGMEAYVIDDVDTVVFLSGGQSIDCEYVVFDLETTGLSPRVNTIIEFGGVKIKNGEIIDKFSSFVNPNELLTTEIINLTKITDDMLEDAPSLEYVLPKFLDFVGEAVLVAHNAKFDIGFLNTYCNKILGKDIDNTFMDTVGLSRMLYPELKNHKLDTVARHLKINLDNHHRALDDSMATAEIFVKEIEELKELNITNLSEINKKATELLHHSNLRADHTIILVKNKVGLRNLYELVSNAHIHYFKRTPRIKKSELIQFKEGLIIGSACEAGDLFKNVFSNMPAKWINYIACFYDYLEVQPIGNNMYLFNSNRVKNAEELCKVNAEIIELGDRLSKPVVATGDVHFLDPEDEIYRRILMDDKFKDADNQPPLYYRSTQAMLDEFSYLPPDKAYEVVVTNTNLIADMVEKILPIPKETFAPKIEGSDEDLRRITMERATKIYGTPLPDIVSERLNRELDSIIKNGFAVMYIIAQKLVWNSLENGYLVGSRGSVGSSFAATMAQITEVNPLSPHYICAECKYSEFDSQECKDAAGMIGYDMPDKNCPNCGTLLLKDGHEIPFETFLGFDGDKEPDIDLNFSSEYQSKAHDYTEELFGKGYVFKAGTISTLAEKTAYGYAAKYLEKRNIVARTAEINRLKNGCTGVRKSTGQHPGGLMVVPNYTNIYEFSPIQRPANDQKSTVVTTHFDYHSISGRLLKLDILGHTAPTIIKMLHESTGVDPLTVDMGDKEVMSLFTSKKALGLDDNAIECPTGSLGLPEFGTSFVRQMLLDTRPSTFTELVRISGLSHGTDVWINNGQDLVKEGIITLKDVISTRDDIMVYLILKGVDKKKSFFIMESVRKGKGLSEEEEALLKENNVPDWYISSCKKIKYMFPKGHAAAYTLMSIRIAYFKIHYPANFYAATFSITSEEFDYEIMCKGHLGVKREMERIKTLGNEATKKDESSYTILELLDEMYARGINFTPIDLYKSSSNKFIVTDEGILPPLCTIQGLGSNAAANIVEEREKEPFETIEEFKTRVKVSKNVIEIMKGNNIFKGIPDSNQLSLF